MTLRCGLVAVLGQANAGKSTLVNALSGQKVSIVSEKPHTTRYGVYGIVCQGDIQMIFIDTPGLIERPEGPLQSYMARVTTRSLREADIFLVVIDASRAVPASTLTLLDRLRNKPLVLVLNKIDQMPKDKLLTMAETYRAWTPHIAMTSAKKELGLSYVMECIIDKIPQGPWLFPEDDLTQISQRFWAAEITREKVFSCVHQEIPYHTHVFTEEWKETSKALTIRQNIIVDQDKYKKWVIGFQGQRIRLIGQQSRLDISEQLDKLVHLFLTVTVDPHWATQLKSKPPL